MARRSSIIVFFISFLAIALSISAYLDWKSSPRNKHNNKLSITTEFPIEQEFRFRFTVENTTSEHLKKVSLNFLLAPDQLANQKSHFKIRNARFEKVQSATSINIDDLTAFARTSFDVTWFTQKPQTVAIVGSYDKKMLNASNLIQSEHPDIISLANSLLHKEVTRETVKNTFQWIVENISYSGYLKQDQGALYALKSKSGDCTEFSYLTTALLRANKIPARVMVGFITPYKGRLTASDLHNWVEVYIDNAWHILDPQNNKAFASPQLYSALGIVEESKNSLGVLRFDTQKIKVTF